MPTFYSIIYLSNSCDTSITFANCSFTLSAFSILVTDNSSACEDDCEDEAVTSCVVAERFEMLSTIWLLADAKFAAFHQCYEFLRLIHLVLKLH